METFAYLQVAETYEASQSRPKATKQSNKTKSSKKKQPVAPSTYAQDDYAVILPWMP